MGIELVKRLGRDNYIPRSARANYAVVLEREFAAYLARIESGAPTRKANYGTWRGTHGSPYPGSLLLTMNSAMDVVYACGCAAVTVWCPLMMTRYGWQIPLPVSWGAVRAQQCASLRLSLSHRAQCWMRIDQGKSTCLDNDSLIQWLRNEIVLKRRITQNIRVIFKVSNIMSWGRSVV